MLRWGVRVAAGSLLAGASPVFAACQNSGSIRIQPIEGIKYPPSFLKFAARARFENPRDAVASVRNRNLPFELIVE